MLFPRVPRPGMTLWLGSENGMSLIRRVAGRLSLVSLTVIAACSTPKPPPVVPTLPPPVVPTVRPLPPMGAVENMSIPDVDDSGKYLTPNRGVTSNTALWHVRMALNVAALACHDNADLARSQYNRMLHVHQAVLNEANKAVDRNYSYAYGGSPGLSQRERLNTVVYNFFSLPPVTKSFCPVAIRVGAKILSMPSSALLTYAPEALAELEKPFQDFYAAYADYLRRLAEWQSRFGASVSIVVSPTPLPPPPVPPGEAPPPQGYVSPLPPPPEAMGMNPIPPAGVPAQPGATVQPTPAPATPQPTLPTQPLPPSSE